MHNGLIKCKIAVHVVELAMGHPDAAARDDALFRAHIEFRCEAQLNLGLDLGIAPHAQKQTLP